MNKNFRRPRWMSIGLTMPAVALAGGLLGAQPSLAQAMGQGAMPGMQDGQMAIHECRMAMQEHQMARADKADGDWHRHGPRDSSAARHSRHQPLEGTAATEASVTEFLESRIKRMDNPRLKVGEVTAKDDKVIRGDIVTVDNSLVWRFEFDRANGRMQPVK